MLRCSAFLLGGCVKQARLSVALFLLVVAASAQTKSIPTGQVQDKYVVPLIVQPLDESNRVLLKGNTHFLAKPKYDRGSVPPDLPMNRMLLVLKRSAEQEAALRSLLDAQQDKHSSSYHKWLTPEEFGKQFGPADSDLQIVTSWLQSHGFQVGGVSHGRTVIEFSGTASQVQQAFDTSIHQYDIRGQRHFANASDPQIPAALAPVVAGVHSLHDFKKQPHVRLLDQKFQATYEAGNPPRVTFSNGAHGLAPTDLKTIYNAGPVATNGNTGQGITIAVVGRSNLYGSPSLGPDVLNFRGIFNVCCGNFGVVLNGADPGDLGGNEELEATLDASWAAAIAPNVNVDFVVSASTNTTDGIDLSELFIIDNNLGQVMSESFGACEQGITSAQAASSAALAEQAAAQGITFFVSSGDSGSAGCDDPNSSAETHGLSASFPASTPYTVAVGGTMFNENGQDAKYWSSTNNSTDLSSALSYIPENVWNESCGSNCGQNAGLWSSGGGSSVLFTKPSWQTGFGPSDGARDLPDVSLTAAGHDAYLLCLEGSCIPDVQGFIHFAGVAGTSASAPSFAGIMALVDEAMGGPQGQADYVFYRLAASETFSQCNGSSTSSSPASTCTFNDTTTGNNCVPGENGYPSSCTTYNSGPGYDLATGLGSVNISNLIKNWTSATFNSTSATLAMTPNPTTITHGAAVTADITVTGTSGMPTGDVSLQLARGMQAPSLCLPPSSCTLKPGAGTTGSVSVTTHALPGGSYNLSAFYPGDGNFSPSTSSPWSVTVNSEPSTTSLVVASGFDASGNPIPFTSGVYGGLMYLQSKVKGHSGFGIPTGSVQFTDNGGSVGFPGVPLGQLDTTGTAWTPTGVFTVGVGTRTLAASYPGDASFSSSISPTTTVTITQATTTTTMSLPSNDGSGTIIQATVNTASRGLPPGGNVTFYSGNASLGTATLTPTPGTPGSKAQSTAYVTSPISGNPSLTATYAGDPNYSGSTSPALVASPDFALWNNAGAGVVFNTPGSTSTSNVVVSSIDSFSGSVNFACSGAPPASTCTFSPKSANLAANGTVTGTVTIQTTGAVATAFPPRPSLGSAWRLGTGIFLVAGFFLTLGSAKPQPSTVARLCLLLVVFLVPSIGCSGGSGSGGGGGGGGGGGPTPSGSYTINCIVSSGSLSHTVSFQLIVQ